MKLLRVLWIWQSNVCQREDYVMIWSEFVVMYFGLAKLCQCVWVFRVGSGCVCAAPGLYPSSQVCCLTAELTGSAAAAPDSSPTRSPTAHSLSIKHTQEGIVRYTCEVWINHVYPFSPKSFQISFKKYIFIFGFNTNMIIVAFWLLKKWTNMNKL